MFHKYDCCKHMKNIKKIVLKKIWFLLFFRKSCASKDNSVLTVLTFGVKSGNEEYEVKLWKNIILFSKLNFTYKPVDQRTALSKSNLEQYFHLYTTCAF